MKMPMHTCLDLLMAKHYLCNNVPTTFPSDIVALQAEDLPAMPCRSRLDLRALPCMTIDCDDTKDMDDAVSLECIPGGYTLGVHIADVSAYVEAGTRLDEEAVRRGTSIYMAHETLPMLPPVLSNDLCSLRPQTDRYAISLLITFGTDGCVRDYTIAKSIIRSRLQGSYSQVNRILAGTAGERTIYQYQDYIETLRQMKTLSDQLRKARCSAGAHVTSTTELKASIVNGEIRLCVREHGAAETMIEEFMILANTILAEHFFAHDLPCIYRTQEQKNVLAKYQASAAHHAELALEHYVHFTSPIRRLPDLIIHRIVSDSLDGMTAQALHEKYDPEYMKDIADIATRRARRASMLEKLCREFCLAQYFASRDHVQYAGTVVRYTPDQQPVFCMESMPVYILGTMACKAEIGERYLFNICADTDRRKLYATDACRLAV